MYPLIERQGSGEVELMYDFAGGALEALDTILAGEDWFFGAEEPGVLDAAVFGYVHLILDDSLGEAVGGRWAEAEAHEGSIRLRKLVERCDGLTAHRSRILSQYYT